jgi:cullin 3
MSSTQSDTFQDSEKIMITKLQAECGFQFTMKIEGMFKDVQYSSELTKRFKDSREKIDENLPFQFNLSILTNTFWPISSQQPVKLNDEMSSLLNKFSQFYKAEFSGRKLEWITQFGSGELKMNGAKDPHDLMVNSNQLIVLMLFNDEESEGEEGLSYEVYY